MRSAAVRSPPPTAFGPSLEREHARLTALVTVARSDTRPKSIPEKVAVCNCTDCQTLSGSAFRVNVFVDEGDLEVPLGRAGRVRQDGRERQQTCPGLLWQLRHGSLRHQRGRGTARLRTAGGHQPPARPVGAQAAGMAPLAAAVALRSGQGSGHGDAVTAPTLGASWRASRLVAEWSGGAANVRASLPVPQDDVG